MLVPTSRSSPSLSLRIACEDSDLVVAESKELIAAFTIIQVNSLEDAIE
ncbi:MAG TPA: hypothetical protein VJO52_10595 [Gemmatimonadaceae bacterium]|nr:hypothetical protein [Gemmatimonadaceae bacterium]